MKIEQICEYVNNQKSSTKIRYATVVSPTNGLSLTIVIVYVVLGATSCEV